MCNGKKVSSIVCKASASGFMCKWLREPIGPPSKRRSIAGSGLRYMYQMSPSTPIIAFRGESIKGILMSQTSLTTSTLKRQTHTYFHVVPVFDSECSCQPVVEKGYVPQRLHVLPSFCHHHVLTIHSQDARRRPCCKSPGELSILSFQQCISVQQLNNLRLQVIGEYIGT